MIRLFDEGSAVLYMKVGTHAQENLADIILRKQEEIDATGFAMWGYGGNTCHPATMVQPFARTSFEAGKPVILAMQPMKSNHFADPVRAEEYSENGSLWRPIPQPINVLGSRYALCISGLEEVEDRLDLSGTRVALGNSRGRPGDTYVRGRVDKACLEIAEDDAPLDHHTVVSIGLIAKLVEPYAVFLRN